jgi:hypothetical protein
MSQRGGDPDPDGRGRRGDFTISASIGGIPCAVYYLHTSAESLDFLELAKNCSFLNWKLASARIKFIEEHELWMWDAYPIRNDLK